MTLIVQHRPLPAWPFTRTTNRRDLPGAQKYEQILDRVENELVHLKATDIVLETGHQVSDTRRDGWPKSTARVPLHPGVVLMFTANVSRGGKPVGALRYKCDRYNTWQENLRAIVLTLEDLRHVSQRGASDSMEQYAGYNPNQLPPADTQKREATPEENAAMILLRGAGTKGGIPITHVHEVRDDAETMGTVYRLAAARNHPDRGGDAAIMKRINAARDLLRVWQEKQAS